MTPEERTYVTYHLNEAVKDGYKSAARHARQLALDPSSKEMTGDKALFLFAEVLERAVT